MNSTIQEMLKALGMSGNPLAAIGKKFQPARKSKHDPIYTRKYADGRQKRAAKRRAKKG